MSTSSNAPMPTSSNAPRPTTDAKKPSMFDNLLTHLQDPLVWGGILVIVILIVVALLQTKSKSGFGSVTETATKYMLSNTPELLGYQ
jgi:hypothetical protein